MKRFAIALREQDILDYLRTLISDIPKDTIITEVGRADRQNAYMFELYSTEFFDDPIDLSFIANYGMTQGRDGKISIWRLLYVANNEPEICAYYEDKLRSLGLFGSQIYGDKG